MPPSTKACVDSDFQSDGAHTHNAALHIFASMVYFLDMRRCPFCFFKCFCIFQDMANIAMFVESLNEKLPFGYVGTMIFALSHKALSPLPISAASLRGNALFFGETL